MTRLLVITLLAVKLTAYPMLTTADTLRDPTRPSHYQSQSANIPIQTSTGKQWVLHSTLISPKQKLAIINGKTLAVGDEINGATVITIQHQSVELMIDDTKTVLSLQKSFIEQIQ